MNTAAKDTAPAPQPAVLGGVTPYLQVDGAIKAAEFYAEAFGAEEVGRHPPDDKGRTMHIHLYINGGSLMMSDAFPEHGFPHKDPQGYTLLLYVDDVDTWWKRAVDTGRMEIVMPLQKQFWGDRYGQLRDPFGVLWGLGAPGD